jgi:hypothetical protein
MKCELCNGAGKVVRFERLAPDPNRPFAEPAEVPRLVPCDKCAGTGQVDGADGPKKIGWSN